MRLSRLQLLLIASLVLSGNAGAMHGAKDIISRHGAIAFMQGTPIFSVDPPGPINMGPSAVGMPTTVSAGPSIQVTNTGTADLTITPSFSSIEFGFSAESLFDFVITLHPGRTKVGNLVFQPQTAGARTGQFMSTDNAAGSPHIVQVTGAGVNVSANDFAVVLDPSVSTVNVSPGKTTMFTVWTLAGQGLVFAQGNIGCSGGPSGTSCTLDHNSFDISNDPHVGTRESFVVSVTTPARSSSVLQRPAVFWGSIPAVLAIMFSLRRRRQAAHALLISGLLVGLAFMISCGSSTPMNNNNPLQLTASRNGVTHTLSVPLNQQ